ncbi:hypothetical protein DFQ09_105246 [Winogradskyella pacifica]|uniref:Uncharacterized protein n=1 Tax=Winogradskyella pacifica TaxID=664642 RepID=A0A3D9MB37_9FLAO|nr:hypothetical protein DFQ09_105246 [Winogradskyella pacifica]
MKWIPAYAGMTNHNEVLKIISRTNKKTTYNQTLKA